MLHDTVIVDRQNGHKRIVREGIIVDPDLVTERKGCLDLREHSRNPADHLFIRHAMPAFGDSFRDPGLVELGGGAAARRAWRHRSCVLRARLDRQSARECRH